MAAELETRLPQATLEAEAANTGDVAATDSTSPSPPSPSPRKRKGNDLPELEVDLSLPEPPSKRAKRALKKGKPLPAKPKSDDEGDGGEQNDAADDAEGGKKKKGKKAERSQFGIWIGNLPFTVTRKELFQWFIDNSGGAIAEADITRVNLPLGKLSSHQQRRLPQNASGGEDATEDATKDNKDAAQSPQNRGFAYVDFATYEAQVAACALSETELQGRRVLIKDSKSFDGRPAKEGGSAQAVSGRGAAGAGGKGDAADKASGGGDGASPTPAAGAASTKVFVGNLGFDTTEGDLRRHFAPCGPVAWAKVATFPDNTEKCRGYGWVQFSGGENTNSGQAAVRAVAEAAAAAAVRGFARVQETVDTEDDFVAEAAAAAARESGDAGQDDGEVEGGNNDDTAGPKTTAAAVTPIRTKTRKWWVNKLKGRPLKIQFAEDDAVRYKKRFSKAGQARQQNQDNNNNNDDEDDGSSRPHRSRPEGRNGAGDKQGYKSQDISIAQRTGAITASLGKRTILE